jgi:hypothetical protein
MMKQSSGYRFKSALFASLIFFVSACSTKNAKTLHALEPAEIVAAQAVIVEADDLKQTMTTPKLIRGSGEGATTAFGGAVFGSLSGGIVGVLLAPVTVPVATIVGASKAHSKDEVDKAVAAFQKVAKDKKLLNSLGQRFVGLLERNAKRSWSCVALKTSPDERPCPDHSPAARINLQGSFMVHHQGAYEPELSFYGEVVVIATTTGAREAADAGVKVAGKWALRQKLGGFFDLTKNNAASLRKELDEILDRFANIIADDLLFDPKPQRIVSDEVIPESVVVRIAQGPAVLSFATNGRIIPTEWVFGDECWISLINGQPTGHNSKTPRPNRPMIVKPGPTTIVLSCQNFLNDSQGEIEQRSILIKVERGIEYRTDGNSYLPVTSVGSRSRR